MKQMFIALIAALAPLAVSAAPGGFTSLECTYDRRPSDGPYYGVDLQKAGDGYTLTVRTYQSSGPFQGGTVVTRIIATNLTCERVHPKARTIECTGPDFYYTLMDTIQIDPQTDERTNVLVSVWTRQDSFGPRWEFSGEPINTSTYKNYCNVQ